MCDGLAGPPRGQAAARAVMVQGRKAAFLSLGDSPGSPLGEAWGTLGWREEDFTAGATLPAMDMWQPVLPAHQKQPEPSKGGTGYHIHAPRFLSIICMALSP